MDPSWLQLIPAGLSAMSSLFAKKPPQYSPQSQAQFAAQMPAFASPGAYQDPGAYGAQQLYDISSSPLYQQMLAANQRVAGGGMALSPEYRAAMLGQGTRELDVERGRMNRQALEDANYHNLAGSGSLGVRQGMIDQGYLRQVNNLQDQITVQDMSERARIQQMMAALENQRFVGSQAQAGLGAQAYQFQQQNAGAQNQWNMGSAEQQNQYNAKSAEFGQQGAQQAYNANLNAWNMEGGQRQGLYNGVASALGNYGLQQQFNQLYSQPRNPGFTMKPTARGYAMGR